MSWAPGGTGHRAIIARTGGSRLTAPYGVDDLDPIARPEPVVGIAAARDDFPVDLHGQPAPGQAERLDQLFGGAVIGHFACLTVDLDFHGPKD